MKRMAGKKGRWNIGRKDGELWKDGENLKGRMMEEREVLEST